MRLIQQWEKQEINVRSMEFGGVDEYLLGNRAAPEWSSWTAWVWVKLGLGTVSNWGVMNVRDSVAGICTNALSTWSTQNCWRVGWLEGGTYHHMNYSDPPIGPKECQGTWHLMWVTGAPGGGAFYVDNTLIASYTANFSLGTAGGDLNVELGKYYYGEHYLIGNMDEAGVAEGVLTYADLAPNDLPIDYQGVTGIQHWWRLGDFYVPGSYVIADQIGDMDLAMTNMEEADITREVPR